MLGFIGSSLSLLILFAASAAPIPLYEQFAQSLDLTKGDLAMTSVMYFAGTIIALVFFARISNYIGRKKAIYLTLVLGILGCVAFIFAHSEILIMLGRFIQGIASGLASSTIMAFILDNEPKKFPNLGVAITSSGPNLGLIIGAVITGIVVAFLANDSLFIFELLIATLFICLIMIFYSQETITPQSGLLKSFIPKIKLPPKVKPLLLPAACTSFASWSFGGFYQSYSATIAMQIFHLNDTFIASLVFISFIGPIAFGAMVAKNYDDFKAQLYGMSLYLLSFLALYLSLFSQNLSFYLAINIIAGFFSGLMFAGSLKTILSIITLNERADVLSAIYIISYGGAAIPNLIISQIAYLFDLTQLIFSYLILAIIAYIILLLCRQKLNMAFYRQQIN